LRKLAPYATQAEASRGRFYDELPSKNRSVFQRDRDRIIHSDAFRRLQYKTQVFVNHEGDHYRTRLTHTIEVAQITRSICRAMGLDDDLGETVALAHDLGHPPFGHAGEDALNEAMAEFGGYRHNEQTLRLVRHMENRYLGFKGLNLTWEALEGIAKHNGPEKHADDPVFDELEPESWCGLEAQVAAQADDIAYNHHDLDDGITSGILKLDDVRELPQFDKFYTAFEDEYPDAPQYTLVRETIRRMISAQVEDIIRNSERLIEMSGVQSVDDVRAAGQGLIQFSAEVGQQNQELKAFLRRHMYRHYRVNRMALKAHHVVKRLFETFMEHRLCLPDDIQLRLPKDKADIDGKARVVCDYISAMTDRHANVEYTRLFDPMTRT